MKTVLIPLSLACLLLVNNLPAQAFSNNLKKEQTTSDHDAWLMERFSAQHEKLTPVVAVADMFFACNKARKVDPVNYHLTDLIKKMDRKKLVDKLVLCLAEDAMQSDVALNFGLLGCFHQQLAHMPKAKRQQKMALVEKAILSLSHSERKKSFTQCVTEQAIHYLQ